MGTDIQLVRQNLPVTGGLVEHDNKVRIFKDILHLAAGEQVFDVLRNSGRNPAPFSETLPDFYGIGSRLFLFQKKMELIHIVASGFTLSTVLCHPSPNLILDNQHPDFFQLLSKLFDVIADEPVFNIHVRPVIEQVQRTFDVNFQCSCHMVGFLFVLCQKCIVEILQQWHILRHRIFKVGLINLVDTAVNDCLFHRLQPFLAAHNQFAERQNKICLQRNGIIFLTVIAVDVHGVDILSAGRADFNDLTAHARHKRCVLAFRITHDDVIIRSKKSIGDLTLCRKTLSGTRCAENQTVGRFQFFPVNHNQIVGKRVQTIIQRLRAVLKQLLGGKRDKDSRGTGGQRTLNLSQVLCQRETAHKPLFLLEVQAAQITVVLLCNAGCLEHIGFQLLQRFSGVHHQKSNQEHSLILALQFLQKRLCVLPVGSQIGGDDVDVIPRTNRFFLFLDLAAIQFCDRALNGLNGLILVYGLNVHCYNLAGFHIQKILQQLVAEIRGSNGEKTHSPIKRSHLERLSTGKRKAAGRNKILYR